MEKKRMGMTVGALIGAIAGRLSFNGFEDMGMRMFLHGDMDLAARVRMALFSSGATKIWAGVIVGGVLGYMLAKRGRG